MLNNDHKENFTGVFSISEFFLLLYCIRWSCRPSCDLNVKCYWGWVLLLGFVGWGPNLNLGAEAILELQQRKEEWEVCSQIRENGSFFTNKGVHLSTRQKATHRNISVSSGARKYCFGYCHYSLLFQWSLWLVEVKKKDVSFSFQSKSKS